MTQFDLTPAELKVARILVQSCLDAMGGSRPSDLESDPFTWVNIEDLMAEGYSRHEAAGFFSSLSQKGFIEGEFGTKKGDPCETFVSDNGYRWMDTQWDATPETAVA